MAYLHYYIKAGRYEAYPPLYPELITRYRKEEKQNE
jgi:hypothetical protein